MKRWAGIFVTLFSVAVVVFPNVSGASDVWAQEKGSTLAIQGSWILVSIYNEQDGKKINQFGPNPRGSFILTPDGRFSMILMRESLPKFASNNRLKGTVEENQAIVQGAYADFGSYKVVGDKEQTVILHVEGSTFPNWDGQDKERYMTVIGDELKITAPTTALGGTNYSIWKRAK
jgi:Lipocalin-like domain